MTTYGTTTRSHFRRFGFALLFLAAVLALRAADEEITAEELISRHLASIGTSEALQQVVTRKMFGEGTWRVIVGGVGQLSGPVSFISSSNTSDFRFDGNDGQAFTGERFAFDGKDASVKSSFWEQYSVMGQFMRRNRHILREGLLGGTANLSWALRDVTGRRAKFKYLGLVDVEGSQLHGLEYRPRQNKGDLEIALYFEPKTYRHVRTEYRERFMSGVGRGTQLGSPTRPTADTSVMEESQVSFVETFDLFQQADGVMVPALWKLNLDVYSEGRASGMASVSEIEVGFQRVHHNEPIDAVPLASGQ